MFSSRSSSETQGQLVGTKGFSWAKVYYNWATSPWALTLTELVPEAFEFPAFDWPEKCFSGQSAKRTNRCHLTRSCFPHRSPRPVDRHSCVGRSKGGILDEIFTKIQRSRANRKLNMAAGKHRENFHGGLIIIFFIFHISYRRYRKILWLIRDFSSVSHIAS